MILLYEKSKVKNFSYKGKEVFMSKADIEAIRACESEANLLRKKGEDEAARILAEGKKKATDLLDTASKEAENSYKQIIEKAESVASEIYRKIIDEEDKACDQIRQNGRASIEKAADYIVGKVVGINGNS